MHPLKLDFGLFRLTRAERALPPISSSSRVRSIAAEKRVCDAPVPFQFRIGKLSQELGYSNFYVPVPALKSTASVNAGIIKKKALFRLCCSFGQWYWSKSIRSTCHAVRKHDYSARKSSAPSSSTAVLSVLCRSSRWAVLSLMIGLGGQSVAMTECSDGIDNDSDGFVDLDDFDCEDAEDATEGVLAVSIPVMSGFAVLLLSIALLVLAGRKYKSA